VTLSRSCPVFLFSHHKNPGNDLARVFCIMPDDPGSFMPCQRMLILSADVLLLGHRCAVHPGTSSPAMIDCPAPSSRILRRVCGHSPFRGVGEQRSRVTSIVRRGPFQ